MKTLIALSLLWLLALVPALAQTTTETRSVASFKEIEVGNGIELRVAAGNTQRVEASADTPELLARLKTEVRGGVLKITFDQELSEKIGLKRMVRNLRVNVVAPPLASLQASSGAKADVVAPYTTGNFELGVSSGAVVNAELTASALEVSVSSGSVATVAGSTKRLNVRASSGGDFKGSALQATACEVSASSGGTVAVAVQETLTAEASSGGDVRYSGSPQVTKRTSSGGSVKSR